MEKVIIEWYTKISQEIGRKGPSHLLPRVKFNWKLRCNITINDRFVNETKKKRAIALTEQWVNELNECKRGRQWEESVRGPKTNTVSQPYLPSLIKDN